MNPLLSVEALFNVSTVGSQFKRRFFDSAIVKVAAHGLKVPTETGNKERLNTILKQRFGAL